MLFWFATFPFAASRELRAAVARDPMGLAGGEAWTSARYSIGGSDMPATAVAWWSGWGHGWGPPPSLPLRSACCRRRGAFRRALFVFQPALPALFVLWHAGWRKCDLPRVPGTQPGADAVSYEVFAPVTLKVSPLRACC